MYDAYTGQIHLPTDTLVNTQLHTSAVQATALRFDVPLMKILCVAEKPSIAKSVAFTLGGGRVTTVCPYLSHLPERILSTRLTLRVAL